MNDTLEKIEKEIKANETVLKNNIEFFKKQIDNLYRDVVIVKNSEIKNAGDIADLISWIEISVSHLQMPKTSSIQLNEKIKTLKQMKSWFEKTM